MMVEGRGESRIHPRFMVGTIGCAVMSSLRKEIQEVICEKEITSSIWNTLNLRCF